MSVTEIPRPQRRSLSAPTFKRVLAEVAESTDILAVAIVGDARARHISRPRQELMWRLHLLGYSTLEIGRHMKRDHSTVVHGIHAHKARISDLGRIRHTMSVGEAA